ncbi:hypothetical protein [Nonomuraea salmonea]|uniref:hypothetical protein n=1 Tax=Nonomuraea salmonea TaxID=46181 RepID=UPI0031EE35A5
MRNGRTATLAPSLTAAAMAALLTVAGCTSSGGGPGPQSGPQGGPQQQGPVAKLAITPRRRHQEGRPPTPASRSR